jgi:hypothetical protein
MHLKDEFAFQFTRSPFTPVLLEEKQGGEGKRSQKPLRAAEIVVPDHLQKLRGHPDSLSRTQVAEEFTASGQMHVMVPP